MVQPHVEDRVVVALQTEEEGEEEPDQAQAMVEGKDLPSNRSQREGNPSARRGRRKSSLTSPNSLTRGSGSSSKEGERVSWSPTRGG